SPEQEPPKSLLLGIGVMTLGSSSFVEEDFLVAFHEEGSSVAVLRGDACPRDCAREIR
ncbi:hypothetical protein A2U01_0088120, partial [Trifolium medium]|nr:hypothetical protein [Trifolium medium]